MVNALAFLALLQTQAPSARFRFESVVNTTIDLSAMGAGEQQQKATTLAILQVTERDSAGGRVADIRVDSLVQEDGGAMAQASGVLPPEMVASGKGAVFHLYLEGGRVRSFKLSMPSNLQANAIAGAIAMIFPSLPPATSVGTSWTDTTVSDVGQALKAKSSEINRWTLIAQDTLKASVTSTTSSEVSADLGTMTATATGERRIIFDRTRQVASASLNMTNSGSMGDVKIKGVTTAVLTRLP